MNRSESSNLSFSAKKPLKKSRSLKKSVLKKDWLFHIQRSTIEEKKGGGRMLKEYRQTEMELSPYQ
ncbi:MAG: hypothetical protein IKN04_13570, partial [Clostridia bacterium]|nr:hypothetical protein [Clostridia bacterium]